MGAGPIPVRDLPDPDQGHPCDGRRLSLSRGRGLPLAIAAQGLRPVADRARLLGPLPPRRRLGGRRPALLTPAARARLGKAPAPSTGIVDSQSVTPGPQKGERGVDGNKKVRGIKRHLLTCSFGFVLAVLVSAANLHDTHGLEPLLERAAEAGWDLRRVKVDAIYTGPV